MITFFFFPVCNNTIVIDEPNTYTCLDLIGMPVLLENVGMGLPIDKELSVFLNWLIRKFDIFFVSILCPADIKSNRQSRNKSGPRRRRLQYF